jgi:antitoxin YefM
MLSTETTYTHARAHLATLLKQVADDRQILIIKRKDGQNVALIAEDELSSLLETVYLLRSPENARRLLAAIERSHQRDQENSLPPGFALEAITQLRQELGIE